jgi:hypothetical protein
MANRHGEEEHRVPVRCDFDPVRITRTEPPPRHLSNLTPVILDAAFVVDHVPVHREKPSPDLGDSGSACE